MTESDFSHLLFAVCGFCCEDEMPVGKKRATKPGRGDTVRHREGDRQRRDAERKTADPRYGLS
jgi:hypothetical protein